MKKQIIAIMVLFCLCSGVKIFSQHFVKSNDLKKPLQYMSLSELLKDEKNIKKAIKKDGGTLQVFWVNNPYQAFESRGVTLSNALDSTRTFKDLKNICESLFNGGYDLNKFSAECVDYANKNDETIIIYVVRKDKNTYAVNEIDGIITKAELAKLQEKENQEVQKKELEKEKKANSNNGYGSVDNATRDAYIKRITDLKDQIEKDYLENQKIENQKNGLGEKTFTELAADYEAKKQYAYALFYYYKDMEYTEKAYLDYKIQRNAIISEINERWLNGYKKIEPSFLVTDVIKFIVKGENGYDGEYEFETKPNTKFYQILNAIYTGNPWIGSFDDFEKYDGWKNLLNDCEKFFTEHPIFDVRTLSFKKLSADMKTKTYNYAIPLISENSVFYNELTTSIAKGLKISYQDTWTEIPATWPGTSMQLAEEKGDYLESFGKIYKKRKSMLIGGIPMVESFESVNKKIEETRETIKITKNMAAYYTGVTKTAYDYTIKELEDQLNADINALKKLNSNSIYTVDTTPAWALGPVLYDVKLNIVDENGNVLAQGQRRILSEDDDIQVDEEEFEKYFDSYNKDKYTIGMYTFSGITSDAAKLIEEGKARIKPEAVYLKYGAISGDDDSDDRTIFDKLPEVQIKLENINFYKIEKIMGEDSREFDIVETRL
ncbi:MAG: hypothetical protein K6A43_01600 [Treponema sp.]|nr:hypothetical protein [Treponema sp.]